MFPRPADNARNAGYHNPHPKEDPARADHIRPLLGAALSVDPATVAVSPSRPVLPMDPKPGGSSRLSPATRRRPASATVADGKDPAPPYRGPGDLSPSCPRGARTAGLASPCVVDRTVRSVTTDGARNDRPAWPGPPRPYKSKNAAPRNKSLAKAASPKRARRRATNPAKVAGLRGLALQTRRESARTVSRANGRAPARPRARCVVRRGRKERRPPVPSAAERTQGLLTPLASLREGVTARRFPEAGRVAVCRRCRCRRGCRP